MHIYLNIILQYNWTAAMLAAKYGHGEVVKELAERGADLTITTVSNLCYDSLIPSFPGPIPAPVNFNIAF
jgi:ankyrin repeat protein